MFIARHNFGVVDSVQPEALGVPGKRIFRILIDGPAPAAATLWVEKEQIYGLSIAVKKMLEGGPAEKKENEESEEAEFLRLDDPDVLEGRSREVLEFKVSRLGLAFGPGEDHITLFFHDAREEAEEEPPPEEEGEGDGYGDEEPQSPPALQVSLTRGQSEAFVRQGLELCASGRGTDALSRHALVATGKVDPNRNGHFRH